MQAVSDLIVITGPPGAGKSTVAHLLSSHWEPSALVDGDAFFAMIDRGYVDPWTEAAHRQNETVVAAAAAAAGRMALGQFTVVYDGVIGPWFLPRFLTETQLPAVHYVILLPPEPVCLERVASRSGHGFTDQTAARHMYREFEQAETSRFHVERSIEAPATIASKLVDLIEAGQLRVSAG